MADIFLSYVHEDQARIAPLVKALEGRGWSVFWDQRIRAGQEWHNDIDQALQEARCVIVAWSRQSVKSSFVRDEAAVGRDCKVLVPIRLDPIEPPIGFRGVQTADLSDWHHPGRQSELFERLAEDIRALLDPQQPPAPVTPSDGVLGSEPPAFWPALAALALLVSGAYFWSRDQIQPDLRVQLTGHLEEIRQALKAQDPVAGEQALLKAREIDRNAPGLDELGHTLTMREIVVKKWPHVPLFVCDEQNHEKQLADIARSKLVPGFAPDYKGIWMASDEFSIDQLRGATTIIFDSGKESDVRKIAERLQGIAGLPEIKQQESKPLLPPTLSYISYIRVVICPKTP